MGLELPCTATTPMRDILMNEKRGEVDTPIQCWNPYSVQSEEEEA